MTREAVLHLLQDVAQAEVAMDGRQGLQKFQEQDFDLVLMDIQMPVMDGLAAVRAMRRWEREQGRPPTPMAALTAHARGQEAAACLEAGFDRHAPKPLTREGLHLLMQKLVSRQLLDPNASG